MHFRRTPQSSRANLNTAWWLILGSLLTVALLLTATFEADRLRQERITAFRNDVADLTRIYEAIVGGRIKEYDDALLVLREGYAADSKRLPELVRLLRSGPLADREILVVLAGSDGYLEYTDAPDVKPRLYLGDRHWFRYFADGGKDRLYIDEPTFGRVTKRYTLPLSRPIYDNNGRFLGVVAVSIKQQSLVDFGARLNLAGENIVTIVNESGALVSRSHELEKFHGTKIQDEMLVRMLSAMEGIISDGELADMTERIVAYRHIHNVDTPLIISVESSLAEVLGQTAAQKGLLLGGACCISLAIIALIGLYLRGRKTSLRLIDTLMRSKEQEYEVLTGTSLDGFCITDGTGRIVDSNATLSSLSGYTREELRGCLLSDLQATDCPESLMVQVEGATVAGGTRFQSRLRRKDGTSFAVEFSVQWMKDAGLFFIFVHDISEIKRAEEDLRRSEGHLRTLVRTIPDLVWLKDKDGVYLSCNQIFERLFGATAAEIVGKTDYDFVDRELADFFRDNDRRAIAAGKPCSNEEWVTFAEDGRRVLLDTIKTPMYDSRGELIGVLGIGRDITERRRAEEENTKLEAQLQQAQKMEAIGQLAGGVAHDFNNMLAVILGHTEMLMDEVAPEQAIHADLEEIRIAAERSTDIVRQLLAFARKQTVAPRVIDLNECVEGMLKMLRRLIGEDVDLAWMPGASIWPIKMDPSQIDQILANLCVNAKGAIAGVGKIVVESANIALNEEYCANHAGFVPGEYVRLRVSDNGCGMSKEIQMHIFEPFFTTKGVGEGTGLGLATVYGTVKQNNGFINVYSEPGQGTTFSIYLPRHIGDAGQDFADGRDKPVMGGEETILLVEDEPTILAMTTTMLQRLGYTVLTSTGPVEAIDLVRSFSGAIHLLATDVIMPEMNGRDLAERLMADKPDMKCLFMSGYTSDIIANQGVLGENVSFIQKPFSKRELATKVRQALSGVVKNSKG